MDLYSYRHMTPSPKVVNYAMHKSNNPKWQGRVLCGYAKSSVEAVTLFWVGVQNFHVGVLSIGARRCASPGDTERAVRVGYKQTVDHCALDGSSRCKH